MYSFGLNLASLYADKEIGRSEFVTLRKYVIGEKRTKKNKDLFFES
jgi:hypothetical protein